MPGFLHKALESLLNLAKSPVTIPEEEVEAEAPTIEDRSIAATDSHSGAPDERVRP